MSAATRIPGSENSKWLQAHSMSSLEDDQPASVAWSRGGSFLAAGLVSGAVKLFDGVPHSALANLIFATNLNFRQVLHTYSHRGNSSHGY